MSVVTLLVAIFVGRVQLTAAAPADLMVMLRVAFSIFTVLCLFALRLPWPVARSTKQERIKLNKYLKGGI